MILINKTLSIKTFEYVYMFIMVVYMSQMTINTAAMITFSRKMSLIAIFIPIVLTAILLKRHKVSFNNKYLIYTLLFITIWSFCIILKYELNVISSLVFLYYAIFIGYIHNKVYGKSYIQVYEHIMVFIAKISLLLWLFSLFLPEVAAPFFRSFPDADYSTFGYNFLFVFNWMDPLRGQSFDGLLRNAGCAWEPGRFAVMLVLAITINLMRNGVKFSDNHNIYWLLAALATTFSTTGYFIAMIMYSIFFVKKFTVKYIFALLLIVLPCFYFLFQLDFMGEKLDIQIKEASSLDNYSKSMNIADQKADDDYAFSLERFPAMYMEWQNIMHDPIIGYGNSNIHSYYYQNLSKNTILTGGIVKLLGNYGFVLGIWFYYVLFISSRKIGFEYETRKSWALFLCIVLSSISYVTFAVPVYTAIWFSGLFNEEK